MRDTWSQRFKQAESRSSHFHEELSAEATQASNLTTTIRLLEAGVQTAQHRLASVTSTATALLRRSASAQVVNAAVKCLYAWRGEATARPERRRLHAALTAAEHRNEVMNR